MADNLLSSEPTDAERKAMIERIQQAVAEEHIDFAELDDRFTIVFGATTRAELEEVATGLPELRQPPPPVASRDLALQSSFSLVGDVKVVVPDGVRVQAEVTSLLGDWTEVVTPGLPGAPMIRVRSYRALGDTEVYSLSVVPVGALRRLWAAWRSRP